MYFSLSILSPSLTPISHGSSLANFRSSFFCISLLLLLLSSFFTFAAPPFFVSHSRCSSFVLTIFSFFQLGSQTLTLTFKVKNYPDFTLFPNKNPNFLNKIIQQNGKKWQTNYVTKLWLKFTLFLMNLWPYFPQIQSFLIIFFIGELIMYFQHNTLSNGYL